jgi:hypothetical protein
MEKFKLFFSRNSIKIFKVEIFLFLFFIVISILFNFDLEAHKYYNKPEIVYNFHAIFSVLVICVFGLFFWILIVYPFVWLAQLVLIFYYKIFDKKKLMLIVILFILYFASIVAAFSLYSIEQHQNIIERGIKV